MRNLVRETRLEPSAIHPSAVRLPRRRRAARDQLHALQLPDVDRRNRARSARLFMHSESAASSSSACPRLRTNWPAGAYADDGIVQRAIRAIKREVPQLLVMTDVCNCEYTSHGHCGKIVDGDVDNDETLEVAGGRRALPCARRRRYRGAVGYDGRPRRRYPPALWTATAIRRYRSSATRPSSLPSSTGRFGRQPNRRPQFGDRRSYQMDPANGREAMREIELDLEEGADMIMVKPALAYLDLIAQARQRFDVPLAAYQVSGRVFDDRGRRPQWLDRPRPRDDRDAHGDPPGGGGYRVDLLRQAGCPMVGLKPRPGAG